MGFSEIDKLNKRLKTRVPLSEQELDAWTNKLFTYYRETGYPHYTHSVHTKGGIMGIMEAFTKIKTMDSYKYYDEIAGVYKKYPRFNGFLFSYFPHWINIPCGNAKTLQERWDDDETLKTIIRKTLQWLPMHKELWTENRLRQNAKIFCSGQTVSNFNSLTAKELYNTFGNKGTVLDMCAGWGGRLLGFIGSDCQKYIGFEPASLTYDGLQNIIKDYRTYFPDDKREIEIYKNGCETMELPPESIDFAFTSPPYFDTEKYSEEDTQSYVKFDNPSAWLNGFLKETFKRVCVALKPHGIMAINIANTSNAKWLETGCVHSALLAGFNFVDKRYYELSSCNATYKKGNKVEPIFIFEKVSPS